MTKINILKCNLNITCANQTFYNYEISNNSFLYDTSGNTSLLYTNVTGTSCNLSILCPSGSPCVTPEVIPVPSLAARVVCALLLVVFGIFGIIGNTLVCRVFGQPQRYRLRVRKATSVILLNLAAADLIACSANVPVTFIIFVIPLESSKLAQLSMMHSVFSSANYWKTALLLMLISLDRHDAMLRPESYRLKPRLLKLLLFLIWTSTFAITVATSVSYNRSVLWTEAFFQNCRNPFNIVAIALTWISFLMVFGVHYRIKSLIQRRNSRTCNRPSSTSMYHLRQARHTAGLKLNTAMTGIALAFMLSYLPWTILLTVYQTIQSAVYSVDAAIVCRSLAFSTHLTNTIIYAGMSKEFMTAANNMLSLRSREEQRMKSRKSNYKSSRQKSRVRFSDTNQVFTIPSED